MLALYVHIGNASIELFVRESVIFSWYLHTYVDMKTYLSAFDLSATLTPFACTG